MFTMMSIAKRHKLLKYPCLGVMTVLLSIYYILKSFVANGRRFTSIAFAFLFFMSSCSFSFAVFSGQDSFINEQEAYSLVITDSDVALAEEKERALSGDMLLTSEEGRKEYENTEDVENVDAYSVDDILEVNGMMGDDSPFESDEQGAETLGADLTVEETDSGMEENRDEEVVFESSDWRLVLVNKQHPIPENYSFNLGTIKGSLQCDERIITDLLSMLQAAKDDGIDLVICSPYRTLDRQEYLFNKKIKLYMNQGSSYMEAYKIASQAVTIPGASEHQIGLALDIYTESYKLLNEGFGETDAGKWLAAHSCEYGFILRYPAGKEYITSIEYEPWHFRYVGKEAATIMTEEDICLEEFWDKYL